MTGVEQDSLLTHLLVVKVSIDTQDPLFKRDHETTCLWDNMYSSCFPFTLFFLCVYSLKHRYITYFSRSKICKPEDCIRYACFWCLSVSL